MPTRIHTRVTRSTRLLLFLLLLTICVQTVPGWGDVYAQRVYPVIARGLSAFSGLFPFAVGDLFIALSLAGILLYPVYARFTRQTPWKRILLNDLKYLLWIYVWFYAAWGLNYSQGNFYERTRIARAPYTSESFRAFAERYIERLNGSYTEVTAIDEALVCRESVQGYAAISDSLGVHAPFSRHPRVKTMLFTPLSSMVGVTGSMGPFFCEFTLNGDLLPSQYPATYAHELAHLLGITGEAEANFYAYRVCTRSTVPAIRFSGYFSVLGHVLSNARRLMEESEYNRLLEQLRPEILELGRRNRAYWAKKYSPVIGAVQDRIYDLYLKGNRIESGRKNYSEVVGLLISAEQNSLF